VTDSSITSEDETNNQDAIKKLDAQINDLLQTKARLTVQADRAFRKKYRTQMQVTVRIVFTQYTV
jgi:hypothetical protein